MSDRYIYFYKNEKKTRLVHQFKPDILTTGIWWLKNHQRWVITGADHNIRSFRWNRDYQELENIKDLDYNLIKAHSKEITDILEIEIPSLVCSCSLDGKIKLWDMMDQKLQTEYVDQNSRRGIRGLSYNHDFGGNLLSYGFDHYINVWCPEISLTRSFIGKLEGHASVIVSCRFIDDSPNIISIDENTNIRVWDIRIMGTIQVINSEYGTLLVNDIAIITKHDRFVLGGKRLQFYENHGSFKTDRHVLDEIYPIQVDFNEYFNYFVVMSKVDIRYYNVLTGKLKKVINFT